jgi:hypothetical protein
MNALPSARMAESNMPEAPDPILAYSRLFFSGNFHRCRQYAVFPGPGSRRKKQSHISFSPSLSPESAELLLVLHSIPITSCKDDRKKTKLPRRELINQLQSCIIKLGKEARTCQR